MPPNSAVAYSCGDLAARGDAELAEHLVQVEFHGGDRDEDPLRYLGVGVSAGRQDGDVPLLRGQVVPAGYSPFADLLAGSEQFGARPFGERDGAAGFEHLTRGVQLPARLSTALAAPEPLAEQQAGVR